MAYSTGSGDYNALMAAVLAHAVADGWVEDGGPGTGWPISKGNVRGVDWATFTESVTNYVTGAGVPHTIRWIKIAVGSSPSDATTLAGTTEFPAYFPNMEFNIDTWHIFSDPSIGDHVNVVYQFSNGVDAKVFGHFSFGELDKHGMSYGGLAYASAHPVRGIPTDLNGDENISRDWQGGNYPSYARHFTGRLQWNFTNKFVNNNFCYMTEPTNSPFPALPIWPRDDLLYDATRLLDTCSHHDFSHEPNDLDVNYINDLNGQLSAQVFATTSQPYSGGVSLMPLPILIANDTSETSTLRFMNLGSAPNVRVCSLANLLDGEEITYAGDTWKVFPWLARKPISTLGQRTTVTSGFCGFAYKKVL